MPSLTSRARPIRFLVLLAVLGGLSVQGAPTGRAYPLEQPPVLDGVVNADDAWRAVEPLSGFVQIQPRAGAPASERTEVFLGYTDTALYVGVVCHDREPEAIVMSDTRRDGGLDDADSFRLVLDTFLDRQTGFVFGTNPSGVQYDAQIDFEGTRTFRSTPGFNQDWDAVWDVRATISETGWSAEMAIPFSSLRYGNADVQSWGVNFERVIRRHNEVAFWAPLPHQFGLERIALAGTIEGIAVPAHRSLSLTPYALGRTVDGGGRRDEQELGVDLKYSLTPSLTLDLTYNTDFAQVEADEQQVNLDRFSLFFPEKRPFFLENAGLFSVGEPEEVELFFSRRIGIGAGGVRLPVDAGARVSGKVGSTNIGLLRMRAGELGETLADDFSVVRVRQLFGERSSAGFLAVRRENPEHDNRTYAVDGRWGIGEGGRIEGFVAQTDTPGIEAEDHAWRFAGNYESETWQARGSVTEVGQGFNPEVGFLFRRDYRKIEWNVGRRIRPESLWGLLEMIPHVTYRRFNNADGYLETGYLHVDNTWRWKNGTFAFSAVNWTEEGVREPFELRGVTVPAGRYKHKELMTGINTDPSRRVYTNVFLRAGGAFGGDQVSVNTSVNYRAGDAFGASLSVQRSDYELPGGDFDVTLSQLRVSYSFTPKVSFQALVQHNAQDDILAVNLRFAWLQSANAGLYLVYNETDDDGRFGLPTSQREVILKYSHIFNVF